MSGFDGRLVDNKEQQHGEQPGLQPVWQQNVAQHPCDMTSSAGLLLRCQTAVHLSILQQDTSAGASWPNTSIAPRCHTQQNAASTALKMTGARWHYLIKDCS